MQAAISGAIYGLGDLTAQTYEGRSWRDFDPVRMLRSAVCGFAIFGPLSHFFYEKLDRYFIISKVICFCMIHYVPSQIIGEAIIIEIHQLMGANFTNRSIQEHELLSVLLAFLPYL